MYICVDIILWVFLQNIVLLPYDYLIETEEFEIFKSAEQKSCKYIISENDLYDMRILKNDLLFDSFENMLTIIQLLLPNNCKKKLLIEASIPIFNRMSVEHMLESCHLN
jgi:hypothetical protein